MLKYCAVWFYDQSFLNGFAYAEIKAKSKVSLAFLLSVVLSN